MRFFIRNKPKTTPFYKDKEGVYRWKSNKKKLSEKRLEEFKLLKE